MGKTGKTPRAVAPAKHGLSYQLREIIEARGLTGYAAGKLAGVDPGVVQRFLTGERDIRMGTADRLALALGLRLVELARARGRPRKTAPGVGMPAIAEEPDPTPHAATDRDPDQDVVEQEVNAPSAE